ncbi:ribose-5-phosphate isomerase RpiA [Paenibacillus xerothermodurans]|uniref:Ribose-5-phosphate isomerase A n=1 Tax=Paenibacillus xerothermodurans TaxID=1977292 RepID=A0A2W1NCK4_PAEXE|nr:ribose-5-phosphate isomerase RpiA [Paenibacillus xerothermodurans]PZE21694.1 ribose-5-phosphate isomerase RpiA [Paenibacillus xerothermodurans]
MDSKRLAGEAAVNYVEDGMLLGLGTGSTVYWSLQKIGELVQSGLRIRGAPTSAETEKIARQLGIPLIALSEVSELDLTIDGADEVNPDFQLIKGGGGALLREKMAASISRRFIVVVDNSKYVPALGQFPLPVEVVPFGWQITRRQISGFGCEPVLRQVHGSPFVTDNGNYILDCQFAALEAPEELHRQLNLIPGVVENGLFVNMADMVIIGASDGSIETKVNTGV